MEVPVERGECNLNAFFLETFKFPRKRKNVEEFSKFYLRKRKVKSTIWFVSSGNPNCAMETGPRFSKHFRSQLLDWFPNINVVS